MNLQSIFQRIKKHWGSIIFYAVILIFIFNTNAKSWVLRQVISTGVLNTGIKKEAPIKQQAGTEFSFSSPDGNILSSSMLQGKVVFYKFLGFVVPAVQGGNAFTKQSLSGTKK